VFFPNRQDTASSPCDMQNGPYNLLGKVIVYHRRSNLMARVNLTYAHERECIWQNTTSLPAYSISEICLYTFIWRCYSLAKSVRAFLSEVHHTDLLMETVNYEPYNKLLTNVDFSRRTARFRANLAAVI